MGSADGLRDLQDDVLDEIDDIGVSLDLVDDDAGRVGRGVATTERGVQDVVDVPFFLPWLLF
jgi:hypothetical protein